MRVAFYTLGCKVNQYETNAMLEQFVKDGFEVVAHNSEADVYVMNSCTVTSESDKKCRQNLRRFRRQNESSVIALCGCFPQAFPDAAEKLPEADVILGASNKSEILSSVKSRMAGNGRIIKINSYEKGEKFEKLHISDFDVRTRAFVKIQDGCERYCAYCIIPTARGPVRSKPLDDLKTELEDLAKAGYKEIVLVGINLSCYGSDMNLRLLDAVNIACAVDGIERVRLGSLEPELLEPEVIKELAKQPKLCPQFHLSLQSGSDGTLKRMRRHYDTAEYRRIVENLRDSFENTAITTDIMVGFPGETEEEFEESMQFAKDIGLARAHVFAYSRRPGTLADRMDNQIDQHLKALRSRAMIDVTDITRRAFLESQVGKIAEVLFETKDDLYWNGYSDNYTHISVTSDEDLNGKILKVKIEKAGEEGCFGSLV